LIDQQLCREREEERRKSEPIKKQRFPSSILSVLGATPYVALFYRGKQLLPEDLLGREEECNKAVGSFHAV
jgi:hypothetical protein